MKRVLVTGLVLLGTLAGACGEESAEEQAMNDVCDARADMQTQVDELAGLSIENATVNGVKENLTAIRDDLRKITDARGDVSDERRAEIDSATKQFTTEVQSIASEFGTSVSLSEAEDRLSDALGELADSYKRTIGSIDCS